MKKTAFIILALTLILVGCQAKPSTSTPPRQTAEDPNFYNMEGVMQGKDFAPFTSGKIEWAVSGGETQTAIIGEDGRFTLTNLPASEEVELKVYDGSDALIVDTIYSIYTGTMLTTYPDRDARLEIDMPKGTVTLYAHLTVLDERTLNCTFLSDTGFDGEDATQEIYIIGPDDGQGDPDAVG